MGRPIWSEGVLSPFSVLLTIEGGKVLFARWEPKGFVLTPQTEDAPYGYGAPRRALADGSLINGGKGTVLEKEDLHEYLGILFPEYNQILLNRYENNNYNDKYYLKKDGTQKLTNIEFRRLPDVHQQFPEEEPPQDPEANPEEEVVPKETEVFYLPVVPTHILIVGPEVTEEVPFEEADKYVHGLFSKGSWQTAKPLDDFEEPHPTSWFVHWPEELLYAEKYYEHHYQELNRLRAEFGLSPDAQIPLIREMRGMPSASFLVCTEMKNSKPATVAHNSWAFKPPFVRTNMRAQACFRGDDAYAYENLAYLSEGRKNEEDVDEILQAWMDSPGHRAAILAEETKNGVIDFSARVTGGLEFTRGRLEQPEEFLGPDGEPWQGTGLFSAQTMNMHCKRMFHCGDAGNDTQDGRVTWESRGRTHFTIAAEDGPVEVPQLAVTYKGYRYVLSLDIGDESPETLNPENVDNKYLPDNSSIRVIGATVTEDPNRGPILSVFAFHYRTETVQGGIFEYPIHYAVFTVQTRPLRSVFLYNGDEGLDENDSSTLDDRSMLFFRWADFRPVLEFEYSPSSDIVLAYPAFLMSFNPDGTSGVLSIEVGHREQYATFFPRNGVNVPDGVTALDMDEISTGHLVVNFSYSVQKGAWEHDQSGHDPAEMVDGYPSSVDKADLIEGHSCVVEYALGASNFDMHRYTCSGSTDFYPIYVGDNIQHHTLTTDTTFLERSEGYANANPEFDWDADTSETAQPHSWLKYYCRIKESVLLPVSVFEYPSVDIELEPIRWQASADYFKVKDGSFFCVCLQYFPEKGKIFYIRVDMHDDGADPDGNGWPDPIGRINNDPVFVTDLDITLWVNDEKIADLANIPNFRWGRYRPENLYDISFNSKVTYTGPDLPGLPSYFEVTVVSVFYDEPDGPGYPWEKPRLIVKLPDNETTMELLPEEYIVEAPKPRQMGGIDENENIADWDVAPFSMFRPGRIFDTLLVGGYPYSEDDILMYTQALPFFSVGGVGLGAADEQLFARRSQKEGDNADPWRVGDEWDSTRRVITQTHPMRLSNESYGNPGARRKTSLHYQGEVDASRDPVYGTIGFRTTPGCWLTDLEKESHLNRNYVYGSDPNTRYTYYPYGMEPVAMAVAFNGDDWIAELRPGYIMTVDLKKYAGDENMIFSSFDDLEAVVGLSGLKSIFPFGSHG